MTGDGTGRLEVMSEFLHDQFREEARKLEPTGGGGISLYKLGGGGH